jgi:hypothetical protein
VKENLRRAYKGREIHILSDSQASLKALASHSIRSKLVWECLQDLITLAKDNKVTLAWVPGHRGVAGNEAADALARQGSATIFTGPEPVLGLTRSTVRGGVTEWLKQRHAAHWSRVPGNRHGRLMIGSVSQTLTADLLQLNRTQIKKVTGLLTGHCHLRKHLHTIGVFRDEPICRLCNEEDETASHVIFECPALTRKRRNFLGQGDPRDGSVNKTLVKGLLRLVEGTNLFQ